LLPAYPLPTETQQQTRPPIFKDVKLMFFICVHQSGQKVSPYLIINKLRPVKSY